MRKDEREAIEAGKKEQELRGPKRKDVTPVNITIDAYTRQVRGILGPRKFSDYVRRLIHFDLENIAKELGLDDAMFEQDSLLLLAFYSMSDLPEADVAETLKPYSEYGPRLMELRRNGFIIMDKHDKKLKLSPKGRRLVEKELLRIKPQEVREPISLQQSSRKVNQGPRSSLG